MLMIKQIKYLQRLAMPNWVISAIRNSVHKKIKLQQFIDDKQEEDAMGKYKT